MSTNVKRPSGDIAKLSLSGYIAGFSLSLILTLAAYGMVYRHVSSGHQVFSDGVLLAVVIVLAITQLFVQLIFFLHLGRESKPRWNLTVLSFAALVVLIIVIGSLWIMQNLNYHHADHNLPQQTDTYIIHDEGIKP